MYSTSTRNNTFLKMQKKEALSLIAPLQSKLKNAYLGFLVAAEPAPAGLLANSLLGTSQ